MKKLLLLVLLFLQSCFAQVAQLNQKEKQFLKNHELTPDEKACLDEIFVGFHQKMTSLFNGEAQYRLDEVKKIFKLFNLAVFRRQVTIHSYHQGDRIVFEHPRFPGYVIKVGFNKKAPRKTVSEALFNDQINNFVDDQQIKISHVQKIQKKIYHRPGRPEAPLNDFNYIIIAEKIDGVPYREAPGITQQHVDDAISVMSLLQPPDAQFFEFDASPQNIFFTKDKKIAFIDSRIRMGKTRDRWFNRLFTPYEIIVSGQLNDKEKLFIKEHEVSDEIKKKLDYIFTHLGQETRDLFSGKGKFATLDTEGTNLMEDEIRRVLYKDGFRLLSTHTLWSRSLAIEHDLLPGYVIKISFHNDNTRRGISRVIAVDEINKIIKNKENGITHLKTIEKKLYHRPGKPKALSDLNYAVVCEKAPGLNYHESPFTKQKTVDDCNVVISFLNQLSIMIDVIPSNILVDEQGCARFIDTEMTKGFFRDQWLEKVLGR